MKYLQKTCAVVVLTLFLLSIIPVAFAGNNGNTETDNSAPGLRIMKASQQAEDKLERAQLKIQGASIQAENKLEKAQLRIQDAREEYNQLKERYREAKQAQQEQRKEVTALNTAVKRCGPKIDDDECQAKRKELKLGVKNHLTNTVKLVERAIEKLKNRIENIKGLSEEEKDNALALAAKLEEKLAGLQEKIDAFDEETTRDEYVEVIDELKVLAKEARKLQRELVGLLVNAKLGAIIEKHEEFRNGMQMRIDSLAEEGADVSELKSLLEEFDAAVEILKRDYDIAKNKWNNAGTAENFDEFVRDLRAAQHQVREDLQETKRILRQFMVRFKEIKENLKEAEETGEELEENGEGEETGEELEENGEGEETGEELVESGEGEETGEELEENE